MDIKPIRSDKDLKAALARVEQLWSKPDRRSRDELEVLSVLVHAYERETIPVDDVDPVDMLKFCMEQQGYTQTDLSRLLGSRSRATEILNRTRPLSLEMIRTIAAEWKLPAEVLIQRPRPANARPAAKRAPAKRVPAKRAPQAAAARVGKRSAKARR